MDNKEADLVFEAGGVEGIGLCATAIDEGPAPKIFAEPVERIISEGVGQYVVLVDTDARAGRKDPAGQPDLQAAG